METKRYFSKIAGSKVIMPDGKELMFFHGFHDLKEEDYVGLICFINPVQGHPEDPRNGKPAYQVYKAELDALIKAGNPLLYVQGSQPETLPKPRDSLGREGVDRNAMSEAEIAQASAAERAVGGRVTGDQNQGTTGIADPNASTVDPSLREALLKPAVGPGAVSARIQALKTAAAQKGTSSNS